MFDVILATDSTGGIGKHNQLPWNYPEDMQLFRKITSNDIFGKPVVIMGRATWESLGRHYYLPNRVNIVLTHKTKEELLSSATNEQQRNALTKDLVLIVNNFQDALKRAYASSIGGKVYVIGGASIYEQAFRHKDINLIYHTQIPQDFNCDTHVSVPEKRLVHFERVLDAHDKTSLLFTAFEPVLSAEQQYLRLLDDVMINGTERQTRNAVVRSVFGREMRFNVSDSFPLLTTKKMFLRGIIEELLFFIRGDTQSKSLEEKGIRIWKGNTTREFLASQNLDYEEGEMGPMYGYQWRHFNRPYARSPQDDDEGIDQLTNLINEIKTNPHSRRLLMTDFNPSQVHEGVLYPCHSLILQFYVEDDEYLSVKMYQRSADMFLGVPFNIASTTLLLYIIAQLTNLKPKVVNITFGDCHVYDCHYEQVFRQLSRLPFKSPKLHVPDYDNLESFEESNHEEFTLIDYECHKGIKAPMVA